MKKNNHTLASPEGVFQLLQGRFRPLITTAVLYLVVSFVLRVVLWVAFGRRFDVVPLQLPVLLISGGLNDLIVLPSILLPLSLLLLFAPSWRKKSSFRRLLTHLLSATVIFALIYLALTQYFFFDEFNSRFNLVSVNYLIYPYEVFVNIWQTYHVLWFLLGTGILTLFVQIVLGSWLVRPQLPHARFTSRLKFTGLHILLLILFLAVFSTDSLSIFSNRVANEIAANGISSFFRALHTNELDYNLYYRTIDRARAFSIMQKELLPDGRKPTVSLPPMNRSFSGYSNGLGKRNIVVIVEESFGAQFVGTYSLIMMPGSTAVN